MYIDLTRLVEGKKDFDVKLQIALPEDSARLIEPCRIFGELAKGIVQVDVQGKVIARIETECARCLTPVSSTLDVVFKVAYLTAEFYATEKESEVRGADLEISLYDGEKIDLPELAREQILLNLPGQSFCREDCWGLCPACGANLNDKNCSCETKEIDPRWAKLRNLVK